MKFSSLLPFALCLAMTASCSSETLSAIGELPELAGRNSYVEAPDTDTMTNTLNEDLYNALSNYENTVEYPYTVPTSVIDDVLERIEDSYPDIFWINGYSLGTYGSERSDCEVYVIVLNDIPADQLRTMHQQLLDKADSIITQIPPDYDDYQKVLYVHDYLIKNCKYCSEGASSETNGTWGTAYGCLIEESAVCQGYSEAFLLLMNRMGIDAGVCTGKSTRGGHAWNYVKIDGKYYWLDITWDDPETENGTALISHEYFLINDDMLQRSRLLDDDQLFVPTCDSLDSNFFVRNNSYLTEYNIDLVRKAFETQGTSSESYELMFADYDTYQTAMECLFTNGEIWDVGDLLKAEESVSYYTNESLYTINIPNL